jgi:hypothetical protein
MAWDADGSVGVKRVPTGTEALTEISASDKAIANNEQESQCSSAMDSSGGAMFGVIFPELREVDGIYAVVTDGDRIGAVQVSADTTNGVDGTWTQVVADLDDTDIVVIPGHRTNITSLAATAQRAIRLFRTVDPRGFKKLHIYGQISPGETPDRLLWIDETTGLEFASAQDYGDVPRGSARDIGVRLMNNSASLTAATIQYTAEDLYLGSGAWYTFTVPGGSTYSSTQGLASLGAGATSGLISARQIVPDDANLGLHAARFYTDVTSWS